MKQIRITDKMMHSLWKDYPDIYLVRLKHEDLLTKGMPDNLECEGCGRIFKETGETELLDYKGIKAYEMQCLCTAKISVIVGYGNTVNETQFDGAKIEFKVDKTAIPITLKFHSINDKNEIYFTAVSARMFISEMERAISGIIPKTP